MPDDASPAAAQPENSKRSSFIRVLIRALGVSFLSVVSLLAAFFAYGSLPQVQDLFFDVRPSPWHGVAYWAEFYVLTVLVWAVPLAFTARLLLLQNFEAIGIDSEKRFKRLVLGLPNFFLLLTSVAVFLGLVGAVSNLPSPTPSAACLHVAANEPVLGVCAEHPLDKYLHTHLAVLLVASIAAVILLGFRNYAARNYYRRVERREKTKSEFYRRILLAYEQLSRKNAGEIADSSTYLLSLKPKWMSEDLWIASQRAKVFMCLYLLGFMTIFTLALFVHYVSYFDAAGSALSKLNFLAYGPVADFLEPLAVRRASFIPVALGAWVPFVSFLALLSNRFQFPIIASLVVIAAVLGIIIGDGHDPRLRVTPANAPSQTLEQAVNAWKAANGCGGAASAACPRPIIAAGEGGGSRAAYLMASTLGHLEDLSIDNVRRTPSRRFSQQLFGISSVSGSSVGAAAFLGALSVHDQANVVSLKKGVYAQNLYFLNVVNAGKDFLGECVTYKDSLQAFLSNDFVSPTMAAFLARDLPTLSRIPFVLDRAGVLESSWETAFADVYGAGGLNPLQAPLKSFQAGAKARSAGQVVAEKMEPGLACGPIPPQANWVPILFANATSGESGRRVVVTPIDWKDHTQPANNAFSDAYDFDELICSEQPSRSIFDSVAAYLPALFSPAKSANCSLNNKMRDVDLRLSTAAGISSRAPFVSPHATIRDQNGRAIDSLVDGGYFDNSGAVTAYELAAAIKRIDPSLDPFVLQVTSEPGWFADSDNCEQENKRFAPRKQLGLPTVGNPELPYQSSFKFMGAVGDALTINNTRVARGFETMVQMPGRMEQLNGKDAKGSYAQVYVCPQRQKSGLKTFTSLFGVSSHKAHAPGSFRAVSQQLRKDREAREKAARDRIKSWKQVSLSWWLSPPLQAYVDGQVYAQHNAEAFSGVIALLGGQDQGKPQAQ
jgi:hypothetical protein